MESGDLGIGPLVCFAKGRPGEWEAICLTFDIAFQGSSEEEVQRSLREAIALFVQSARDERDPKLRHKLLHRRGRPVFGCVTSPVSFCISCSAGGAPTAIPKPASSCRSPP